MTISDSRAKTTTESSVCRIIPPLRQAAREHLDNNSIEQLTQHLPFDCRSQVHTGFSFSTPLPDGSTTYVHAFCKRRHCRTCAKRLYFSLHRSICAAIPVHTLSHFLTLTFTGRVTREKFSRSLNRFFREARRTFPTLTYLWIAGTTRRRHLHVHVLVNVDLRHASRYGQRTKWLRPVWHRITGATQVTTKPITSGTEANIAQYLLVNLFQLLASNTSISRRYGSSRCIRLNPPVPTNPEASSVTWKHERVPTAYLERLCGKDPNPTVNPTSVTVPPEKAASIDERSESITRVPPRAPLIPEAAGEGDPAGERRGSRSTATVQQEAF